jgi:hypothetical protein
MSDWRMRLAAGSKSVQAHTLAQDVQQDINDEVSLVFAIVTRLGRLFDAYLQTDELFNLESMLEAINNSIEHLQDLWPKIEKILAEHKQAGG